MTVLFSSTYINKLEVCKSEQSIKVYLEHIEDINESESVLIKNAFESKFVITSYSIHYTKLYENSTIEDVMFPFSIPVLLMKGIFSLSICSLLPSTAMYPSNSKASQDGS